MKKALLLLVLLFLALPIAALQPPMKSFVVSSGIGYRVNPMGGGERDFHKGLDLVGPHGAYILAAGDGVVVEHWPPPGTVGPDGRIFTGHPVFGGFVIIDHRDGLWTLYGHMSKTFVHTGQRVRAGQVIGIQGSTGDSTGEHLHFEVIVDPRLFFAIPLGVGWRERKELLR